MMFVEDEKKEKTKKKKELNPVFTNIHLMLRNRLQCYSKSHFMLFFQLFHFAKGQLISKGHFGFFNSPEKRTENFCTSRLGQNFEFSSSFFGRFEDTKKTFRN